MDVGGLKYIDNATSGHSALAPIGFQESGPKFPLTLALHDGPESSISLILDALWKEVPRFIDELTLLLKPNQSGGGYCRGWPNLQKLDEYTGDLRTNVLRWLEALNPFFLELI